MSNKKAEQKFMVVLPGIVSHGRLVGFEVWPGLRPKFSIPVDAPIMFSKIGRQDSDGRDLYAVTIALPKRVVIAWSGAHWWWRLWDLARDDIVSMWDPIFAAAHDPLAALYFSYLEGDLLVVNRLRARRLRRFYAQI